MNQGVFVKSVTKDGNGLLVTMSDGSTNTIANVVNEEVKPGSVVEINKETGAITIDGEETGFFAVKDAKGEVKMPYVNAEGELITFDAEGKEVKTGIKANPVTAVQNADGSYTLTIPGANGEKLEIKLPSPASAISGIVVKEGVLKLNSFTFGEPKNWKGPKKDALPAKGTQMIVGGEKKAELSAVITPASVDGTTLTYDIVDSKMNAVKEIALTPSFNDSFVTKAANAHYNLEVVPTQVAEADYEAFTAQFAVEAGRKAYALRANGVATSDYSFKVDINESASADFGAIKLYDGDKEVAFDKLELNKVYTFKADVPENLFDMYITIDDKGTNMFKATVDNEARTLVVTKNPDAITASEFTVTVETLNIKGEKTTSLDKKKVSLTTQLIAATTYELVPVDIQEYNSDRTKNKNYFEVDLDIMRDALGAENLTIWNEKVNHWHWALYDKDDKAIKEGAWGEVFGEWKPMGVNALGGLVEPANEEAGKASFLKAVKKLRFHVNNAKASAVLTEGETYYAKFTFYSEDHKASETSLLNTVVVPVQFNVPALSTLFAPLSGFQDAEGVINAYFYMNGTKPVDAVDLNRYFDDKKVVNDATVTLPDEIKIGGKKVTTTDVFTKDGADFEATTLKLNGVKQDNGLEKAYGFALPVTVKKNNYCGWDYDYASNPKAGEYTFKIRLMSPIEQGTIETVEGKTITLTANDLKNGALITSEDIIGKDYTGKNTYNIVPDALDKQKDGSYYIKWSESQLAQKKVAGGSVITAPVTIEHDKYLDSAVLTPATEDKDGNKVNGAIKVTANSISSNCESVLTITVEDAWGYKKTQDIKLNLVK